MGNVNDPGSPTNMLNNHAGTPRGQTDISKALDKCCTGRDDGTGTYMGTGGARWRIEGTSGFKGSTEVSSVSNSAETARVDHGNGTGTYLDAEAARQHVLEAEHLSNHADEWVDTDMHRAVNDVIMPTTDAPKRQNIMKENKPTKLT